MVNVFEPGPEFSKLEARLGAKLKVAKLFKSRLRLGSDKAWENDRLVIDSTFQLFKARGLDSLYINVYILSLTHLILTRRFSSWAGLEWSTKWWAWAFKAQSSVRTRQTFWWANSQALTNQLVSLIALGKCVIWKNLPLWEMISKFIIIYIIINYFFKFLSFLF